MQPSAVPPGAITPTPTDDEAAAIAAALAVTLGSGTAAAPSAPSPSRWVDASRRAAQRAGFSRGPWRMSGRLGRRSRI